MQGSGHDKFLIIHYLMPQSTCFQGLYCLFRPRKEPYWKQIPPGANTPPPLCINGGYAGCIPVCDVALPLLCIEQNSTFCPRKTNYRPLLRGTNYIFAFHISYFSWPDPGKTAKFLHRALASINPFLIFLDKMIIFQVFSALLVGRIPKSNYL